MKTKNGVSFGLLSGIFWGLGLTISAYIFSIFTDLSPFVVAGIGYLPCGFSFIGFLLFEAQDFEKYCIWDCLDYWRDNCSDL